MNRIPALFAMSRPTQLVAVTLVYLYGAVIAAAQGHPVILERLLWGLSALLPTAASIHLVNEYADYHTDRLTKRTPFSGGSGAFIRYDVPRNMALRWAWGAAVLAGVIAITGWLLGKVTGIAVILLMIGWVFGWMYSLQPFALAWRGWGELDNAALGGMLLPVYGFATLAPRPDPVIGLTVLPFGLIVFTNLLATTWPDKAADASVGKRTLATRLPVRTLRVLYWFAAGASFGILPFLADHLLPPVVVQTCMLTAPFVIWGGWSYTRQHSPLPTVTAMIVMLITHTLAWFSTIG